VLYVVGYVCGVAAPVIASRTKVVANTPAMTSGALLLITGLLMMFSAD
jgi:hypothetical protein